MLSQEKIFFLSINYAFWYFDDRKPWNINHIGYPATDKNKKHLLFWLGSDSSLADQTSIEEKKKKKKTVFSMFDLKLLLSSSPKKN